MFLSREIKTFYLTFSHSKSSEMHVAPRIFSTTFNLFWDIFSGTLLSPTSLIFLGHIFGTLFWETFCGLSVLYLISLKSLTSFENIALDGTFSTVPGCTWLCLGLPCSNLPQTATDWLKLFCIYRLKCSKAISGTERDKWDGNVKVKVDAIRLISSKEMLIQNAFQKCANFH